MIIAIAMLEATIRSNELGQKSYSFCCNWNESFTEVLFFLELILLSETKFFVTKVLECFPQVVNLTPFNASMNVF